MYLGELHHEVDEALVFEVGDETDDVWVVNRLHDAYLVLQLLYHLKLDDFGFLHELDSIDLVGGSVNHFADLAEASLSQIHFLLEVLSGKFAGG